MFEMENPGYKFFLTTATYASLAFKHSSVFCLSHKSDNFILYFPSYDVNLCLPPDLGDPRDHPQPGFFLQAGEVGVFKALAMMFPHATRFFVHFFVVTARSRREISLRDVLWKTTTAMRTPKRQ